MKNKRLIHLVQGQSDSIGFIYSCCNEDILIKFSRDTKRGITCNDCLKQDKKYNVMWVWKMIDNPGLSFCDKCKKDTMCLTKCHKCKKVKGVHQYED